MRRSEIITPPLPGSDETILSVSRQATQRLDNELQAAYYGELNLNRKGPGRVNSLIAFILAPLDAAQRRSATSCITPHYNLRLATVFNVTLPESPKK